MIRNAKHKTIFLLGGYDLEMLTIREILEKKGLALKDNKLEWSSALLSNYKDIFTSDSEMYDCIYGIELSEDIAPPVNYKRIDHHNDMVHMPSSLEQIAGIIGVELNRFEQLIAVNDSRFIPGLQSMGASEEEIDLIRRADRNAQGVTEEDELLAQKSIQENFRKEKDIAIIRSFGQKFSPITDYMFDKEARLLIYTDNKLCYYGPGTHTLSQHFKAMIQKKKAYTGGGENGFFGIAENVLTPTEIENGLVDEIINLLSHG